MKLTSRHFAITLLAGTIGLISSTAAWAYEGQQYAQEARISPDKAETIAMNASRPCGFRLSKGFFILCKQRPSPNRPAPRTLPKSPV